MDRLDYQRRYDSLIKAWVMAGDLLLCNLLFHLACTFCGTHGESSLLQSHLLASVICFACTVNGGVILHYKKVRNFQIVARVMRNVFLFSIFATPLLVWGNFAMPSWWGYAGFLSAMAATVICFRLGIRKLIKNYWKQTRHRNGVVLVGSTENNIELYHELTGDPSVGYWVCGYFDHAPNSDFPQECPYLGTPSDVIPYLQEHGSGIRNLYCCLPSKERNEILAIIHYCENHLVRFYSVPNVRNYLYHRMHFSMMGSVPCLSLHEEPLSWIENRMVKRAFDIVFSLAFLCTLFIPILIIVTLVTKLTMPGPVFFRQKRNGINGKEFYCLKFRSMRVNADADRLQATKDDPRKTRWGNIMRKTNIDELPQFINVLLGDMSVVGPRPHMVKHTEEYSLLIDKYMVRHFIKPGITGWSQINGFRGETKELKQMEGRIRGDIWYIEHWNFGLDLYIIYKTVANALHGDKNAY